MFLRLRTMAATVLLSITLPLADVVLADTPQPATSSPAAQRGIDASISAALQGDGRRALQALTAVAPGEFVGKDAEYRVCMIERFGRASPPSLVQVTGDAFADQALGTYQRYWWSALTEPAKLEELNTQLQRSVRALLHEDIDDWEALEARLAERLRERGFHAQLGRCERKG